MNFKHNCNPSQNTDHGVPNTVCRRRSWGLMLLAAFSSHSMANGASLKADTQMRVAAPFGIMLGYGFKDLCMASLRSKEQLVQEHKSDRMAALELPVWGTTGLPRLYLGPSSGTPNALSHVYWPEWGYHDAKISERAPYSFPTSPREGLAYSDKEIFEEALRRRAPGLMNSGQAYVRDYRDSRGNDLRIVAARLPDGQTYVAESNGRNATAYEIYTQVG